MEWRRWHGERKQKVAKLAIYFSLIFSCVEFAVCSKSVAMKTEGVEVEAEERRLLRVKREIYTKIAVVMQRQEMSLSAGGRGNRGARVASTSHAAPDRAADHE
jgi:hypothetical protein